MQTFIEYLDPEKWWRREDLFHFFRRILNGLLSIFLFHSSRLRPFLSDSDPLKKICKPLCFFLFIISPRSQGLATFPILSF